MSMIPTHTLVVVADGGDARFFRNAGEEHAIKLRQEAFVQPDPESGHGPSGMQPKDSDRDEASFAHQLAMQINRAALAHKFDHIVLAADPTTLGELRKQLHKETSSRMLAEIAKDWTNAPVEQIERALGELKIGNG